MIRIFSIRNPAITQFENKLHKLRIGLILTLWVMLLVSILVGKLNFRNPFALALNVLCFACLNIICEFILTTPLYFYCIYTHVFDIIIGFANGTVNPKGLALDILYVIIYLLGILITWRGVQLLRFIGMYGAWSAVVMMDQEPRRVEEVPEAHIHYNVV